MAKTSTLCARNKSKAVWEVVHLETDKLWYRPVVANVEQLSRRSYCSYRGRDLDLVYERLLLTYVPIGCQITPIKTEKVMSCFVITVTSKPRLN
ncbi:hypothetical protein J6590_020967 [Homalodisca vitripennis]|nr:hypothetical protein J6590_020967 [Homalodisca vitripennis]